MFRRCTFLIGAMLLTAAVVPAAAQPQRPASIPSIDDRTAGMTKIDGYFPLFSDARSGSMFIEMSRFDSDFLFIDRAVGGSRVERHRPRSRPERAAAASCGSSGMGPRVMLVQPNQSFRSSSRNPLERKSVEDSFANRSSGVRHRGRIRDGARADRRDRLPAARRAWRGRAARVPGTYRVDRTRSAFFLPNTRNFAKNTEIDMTLTFVAEPGGGRPRVRRPDPGPCTHRPARDAAARVRPRRRPLLGQRRQRDARRPTRSRFASTSRSSNCPTATYSRASMIPGRATAGPASSTTALPSATRWCCATSDATACRRRTRRRPRAIRSRRFSTGSIRARPTT